ncbi:MAG: N-acetyltransferase [Brevibacterium sp.]|uniref:GNAT family N-acetyltransferase n=1 Tax=Brevibacterium sp. TaxID=1701 RepID=UPI00264A0AD1|nr:GNAT family N-acetyltransferase [Brevibacterium sp.]MDN5808233.1 N-acetyltransferase [Brevibacterium sp.]MDN5834314.1 N-acetyltransferase [Brevibacterium sp.]MDN5877542.1 N-acetyltransferase [Brevibacterium sp.]MDN5910128.1 N-acetyltransferase [Brevibacterium sp.]MDN6122469.1 N-acetyltransferase [Brevibacterium sp.]
MDLEISGETFTFAQDTETSRFTLSHDGTIIGLVDYIDREASPDETTDSAVRTFTHTEVSPTFGGRGLAAHLVRFALETSAEADLKFRTTCSYVMEFFRKNPEFEELRA